MKILLILFFVILNSCSKDEKTSFSGAILNSAKGIDGVKVALYLKETPNQDVSYLTKNFNVGLEINQKNVFDHRYSSDLQVYSDFTDSQGNFSIDEVKNGEYNLVITKEGYGKIYDLDFEITSSKTLNFELSPDDTLENEITSEMTLLSGQNYFVSDILTIEENGKLIIPEGCQIKLKKNAKIRVFGELQVLGTFDNPVEFFCENYEENWNELKLQTDAISEINYLIASNFLSITYNNADVSISNSVLRHTKGSLELSGVNSCVIENCLMYQDIDNTSIIQIQSGVDNSIIRNNIFSNSSELGTSDCINLAGTPSSRLNIENNVFIESYNGVTINGGNETVIDKNLFYNLSQDESSYALRTNGNTKMVVINNNFLKNSVNIYFTFDGSPKDAESLTLNNFFESSYLKWNVFLDSGLHEGTAYGLNDMVIPQNYWGELGPNSIRDGNTPNSYPGTGIVDPQNPSFIQINNSAPLVSD